MFQQWRKAEQYRASRVWPRLVHDLLADWPATVVVPCGMGDARNLLMALSGDACLVIGGRAGTISEVCLAWLHHRPLLPLVGCGGWSDDLPTHPPDERQNSPILPWDDVATLEAQLRGLGLIT